MKRALGSIVATLSLVLASFALAAPAPASGTGPGHVKPRPIVFVHGSAGSASQFQTPALRFASNGYRAEDIEAVEYDTQFQTNTLSPATARNLWSCCSRRLRRWVCARMKLTVARCDVKLCEWTQSTVR